MENTIPVDKDERISRFNQSLEVVNDDWPLLTEIGQHKFQNKFVINKKKSNVNVAKVAREIMESSSKEDTIYQEESVKDHLFQEAFDVGSPDAIAAMVNDLTEKNFVEVGQHPSYEDVPEMVEMSPALASVQDLPLEKQEPQSSNKLLKMVAIGLTTLYVRKTTSVLNPVKFMADNYKNVVVALLHLGVPLIMTWFLVSHVSFIKDQMPPFGNFMYWLYAAIFYFACLFAWVTLQVVSLGFFAMCKTTLVSVANEANTKE